MLKIRELSGKGKIWTHIFLTPEPKFLSKKNFSTSVQYTVAYLAILHGITFNSSGVLMK